MRWYKITNVPDLNEPFIKKVKAGSKSICLIGYESELYALSSVCPHAGADMSDGLCAKGNLVCPFHRYTYNLKTGKGGEGQNDFVATYPVEIRAGEVFIGVNSVWDKVREAFR